MEQVMKRDEKKYKEGICRGIYTLLSRGISKIKIIMCGIYDNTK